MNISLSEDMYSFILEHTRTNFYSSASEYVRSLFRQERARNLEKAAGQATEPRKLLTANECMELGRTGEE